MMFLFQIRFKQLSKVQKHKEQTDKNTPMFQIKETMFNLSNYLETTFKENKSVKRFLQLLYLWTRLRKIEQLKIRKHEKKL